MLIIHGAVRQQHSWFVISCNVWATDGDGNQRWDVPVGRAA